MKTILYKKIKNNVNGNPRYELYAIDGSQSAKWMLENAGISRDKKFNYIVVSYNIKGFLSEKFPDTAIIEL